MKVISSLPSPIWTVAQLRRHFGMIPAERIVLDPPPGTATEEDVIYMDDHCDRLCELLDGVLVEKAMGSPESRLACIIIFFLEAHTRQQKLGGAVLAPDGFSRLVPGLVRAPDVSYFSKRRLPGGRLPKDPITPLAPDLAVEVISRSNTKKEMERKLREYFENGVRLVWLVRPRSRTVDVYTAADEMRRLRLGHTLDGGDVLPGFALPLKELFNAE